MDIRGVAMDIIGKLLGGGTGNTKSSLEDEVKSLTQQAKDLEERASLVEEKAKQRQRIIQSREKIKRFGGESIMGGWSKSKWLVFIGGTIVLFAVIKMMGC